MTFLKSWGVLAAFGSALGVIMASAAPAGARQARPAASGFAAIFVRARSFAGASLAAAERSATRGAVSADGKSLTFTGKAVRLVVETGPDNDMLSYRIAGLRNPTLVLPQGAVLKALFINRDGDMPHNVRFGPWRAKFPNAAEGLIPVSAGAPPVTHAAGGTLHGTEMVLKAPARPGRYAYFCTVRGHAQGGMWGTIQVR